MATTQPVDQPPAHNACEHLPLLERMNYCYGQMLGAQDFLDEQRYFRDKIHLLSRCLHGYGVVCGLEVHWEKEEPAPATTPPAEGNLQEQKQEVTLTIDCGVAVDPQGRELVVGSQIEGNLFAFADDAVSERILNSKEPFTLYVTLCYDRIPGNRQPLPNTGECADLPCDRYIYTRWLERPCVRLTFSPPPKQTCDPCCHPIEQTCVWLASITFKMGSPLVVDSVDNTIRRPISVYQPTTISGVNWFHGAYYPEAVAKCLLADPGLKITFSAPIEKDSIRDGVVDLLRIDECASRGTIEVMPIDLVPIPDAHSRFYQLLIRPKKPRSLDPEDRILIKVRCDFILDKCCRPVDGNHVGGRIPYTGWEFPEDNRDQCSQFIDEQPGASQLPSCQEWLKFHPRTSGNGVPGGDFESWFFVR